MNIKQIEIFKLKALRMAGFLEFVQQVLNIVKTYRDSGEQGVSQLPAKVEAAYTPFTTSVAAMDDAYKLSRASEFTQQIADEDTRRDGLYIALKNQVMMYTKFIFDAQKKAAGTYLWNIIRKYNVDITENYHEESVKLQQMIQELEDDNVAGQHITALGISSLVSQLKTANEAVRTLLAQRNDERMLQEKAALANARNRADEAYRDLTLMINAATAMEDDQESIAGLEGVISQVNELIKYYRQYVAPKGTGSLTPGPSPTGEGSENSSGGTTPTPTPDPDNGGSTGDNTGGGSNTGGGGNSGGGSNTGGGGTTGGNTGGGGDNGGGGESGDAE